MTTTVINDAESIARQRKLLAAFETEAVEWAQLAYEYQQVGEFHRATTWANLATISSESAARVRRRIEAATGEHEAAEWLPPAFTAPPVEYQTFSPPSCGTVTDTVVWLCCRIAAPLAELQRLARWLLDLRAACWSGRWLP